MMQVGHFDVGVSKRRNGQNGAQPILTAHLPTTKPPETSQRVPGDITRAVSCCIDTFHVQHHPVGLLRDFL